MWEWAWLVPLLPLTAFVILIFFGGRLLRERAWWVAIPAILGSAVLSWLILVEAIGHFLQGSHARFSLSVPWASIGPWVLEVGYQVDPLAAVMLAMVGTVASLIQIYSIGYMQGDPRFARFFAYLSLFCAAMLALVLANNFLLLFVAWELVGLCSYLLIGFWFERPSAMRAAKKAFLVTKLGDIGFLLGLMLLFSQAQSFDYEGVFQKAHAFAPLAATLIPILLFCGAVGKSAQFPLHIWLPDAMEGPTPVSALIHAATMVAAGVYMVARLYPLFHEAPRGFVFLGDYALALNPMGIVAWIGGITALMAATMGVVMFDIKRVLAYSTISQLGYMMMGLGVGGYTAGMFHLITHAFFKALLFLGSGSVIHGTGGLQDIREMGGLRRSMPHTFWTFLIATLAIAGIPPLSGFWSKDEILNHAWAAEPALFWMGLAGAFLTAFYMGRLVMLTFMGEHPRHPHLHPHESPPVMTVPLWILALFSALLGLVGTPWANAFGAFVHYEEAHHLSPHPGVMAGSVLVGLLGLVLAGLLYGERPIALPWGTFSGLQVRRWLVEQFPLTYQVVSRKYYMDEIWWAIAVTPTFFLSRMLARFDQWVIDGLVNLTGWLTVRLSFAWRLFDTYVVDGLVNLLGWFPRFAGRGLRLVQMGRVQGYLVVLFLCLLALTVWRVLSKA